MTGDLWGAGVRAGAVAAAATIGAVATFAARAGTLTRPFAATGRALLGGAAPSLAVGAGLLAYVALGIVCGVVVAALAGRARGARLLAAAAAASLLAYGAAGTLAPMLRLGFGIGAFPVHGPPLVFLHVLLAVALAVGMRLAR